jgi:hypothetical protein
MYKRSFKGYYADLTPEQRAAKEAARKEREEKAHMRRVAEMEKRMAKSKFNYAGAGGYFYPTQEQYNAAVEMERAGINVMQASALQGAFLADQKVHHDTIHVINEWRREQSTIQFINS